MAIKITIVSTKGGTGKTTLTANLGAILADLNQRVLMVDADVQPALSSYYPLEERAENGLNQLIQAASVENTISKTCIPGLDLIYSDDPEGQLPNWMLHAPDGRVRLKYLLEKLEDDYDVILIDTQGTIGVLQDAAVLAADLLISPIPPEMLSAREFSRGTIAMIDRLRPMVNMGAPVAPLRGLIYRQDRTVDARTIAQQLRRASFGPSKGAISILETTIPKVISYLEATTKQVPVHQWEKTRTGPTASARETMLALIHELFPHMEGEKLRSDNSDVVRAVQ